MFYQSWQVKMYNFKISAVSNTIRNLSSKEYEGKLKTVRFSKRQKSTECLGNKKDENTALR